MKRTITPLASGAFAGWITVALLVVAAGYSISSAVAAEPPAEWDGLVRVTNTKLDHVYVLPEADFSGYQRIRLSPVDVSFDRAWARSGNRSLVRVSAADMENVRTMLAREFRSVFADELGSGGYTLVDKAGEDVLQVTAAITNLYITGPLTNRGASRTFVANTSRMTLVAHLHDSVTGELLARAVDTVQARRTPGLTLATPTSNLSEVRAAMRGWARILRTGLGDAEGRSGR
jgi:hypothetical protein